MARSKNGKIIRPCRRRPKEQRRLRALLAGAERDNDLKTWRRAKAVKDYMGGTSVMSLSMELNVARSTINRWLQRFDAKGTRGLRPIKHPGSKSRLTEKQLNKLVEVIEAGPQAAGFDTGIWTGPMVGDWIRREFGVEYHNHYIPRLLHRLGFSVQRPRKRLARADKERQEQWLNERFPTIKKSRRAGWSRPIRG
jgi:transposase